MFYSQRRFLCTQNWTERERRRDAPPRGSDCAQKSIHFLGQRGGIAIASRAARAKREGVLLLVLPRR
jgi:hypothetical protein